MTINDLGVGPGEIEKKIQFTTCKPVNYCYLWVRSTMKAEPKPQPLDTSIKWDHTSASKSTQKC